MFLVVPKKPNFNDKNIKEFYWGQENTLWDVNFDSEKRQLPYAAIPQAALQFLEKETRN